MSFFKRLKGREISRTQHEEPFLGARKEIREQYPHLLDQPCMIIFSDYEGDLANVIIGECFEDVCSKISSLDYELGIMEVIFRFQEELSLSFVRK